MFWPFKQTPPGSSQGGREPGAAAGDARDTAGEAARAREPQGEEILCRHCKESIGIIAVRYPTILNVHCPLCGHVFPVRATPEGMTPETPEVANPPAHGWRHKEPQRPKGKE